MIKRIVLFTLCIIVKVYAQNINVNDSIEFKLKSCAHDTDRVILLNTLANTLHSNEPFEAKNLANKAIEIATRINYMPGKIKAIKLLGIIAFKQGDSSGALKNYLECLMYYEQRGELKGMSALYNNIGLLYGSKHQFDKAIQYHRKSLAIKTQLKDEYGIASSYNNIGIVFSSLRQIDSSMFYNKKSLEIRQRINDFDGLGTSYYNLANNYSDMGDAKLALESHVKSLGYFKKVEDYFNVAFSMNEMAINYARLKDYQRCFNYLDSALVVAKQYGVREAEMELYKSKHQVYNDLHNADSALKFYQLYSDLRFDLNNQSQAQEVGRLESKYEYESKIHEQKLEQERKDEVQKEKSIKQNIIIWSIALVLGILIVFFTLLIGRFRIIKGQKLLIEHQKKIVDEKQKEVLDSIHYAKRIQNTLLAHKDFLDENLPDNFVLFKPKDIVSGDFYWAASVRSKQVAASNGTLQTVDCQLFYLAVCDSTGHGVPGAFMSLLNIGFLSEAINEKNILEPHKILEHVRQRLIGSVSKEGQQDGFDGILLCIDQLTNEITYAAAHNAPVLVSNNMIIELEKDKMPVGQGERIETFKLYSVKVSTGDILYLYTDGYADQFGGAKGKKFKYKPLNELLLTNSSLALNSQAEQLLDTFNNWKGHLEQVDDVCVIGIRF